MIESVVGAPAAKPAPLEPDGIRAPRTYVLMLIAVAGIGIGLLVVYFDRLSWGTTARHFAAKGAFRFWVSLIVAQTMLWTLALPPLLALFRRHWQARAAQSVRREVLPSALVLGAFVATLVTLPRLFQHLPEVMPHHELKINIVSALALIVALIACASIWLIRGRAEALATGGAHTQQELQTYLSFRADLELLLVFLGAVIGLAVFGSAAFRNVVLLKCKTVDPAVCKNVDFTADSIVLYGFVLSFLLALVYLPTFLTLQRTGTLMRDRIQPLPNLTDPNLNAKIASRNGLDELLGLKVSASGSFRAGVAILTPLLGSLTSLIPKLGG
jgi:hypothetical protein